MTQQQVEDIIQLTQNSAYWDDPDLTIKEAAQKILSLHSQDLKRKIEELPSTYLHQRDWIERKVVLDILKEEI